MSDFVVRTTILTATMDNLHQPTHISTTTLSHHKAGKGTLVTEIYSRVTSDELHAITYILFYLLFFSNITTSLLRDPRYEQKHTTQEALTHFAFSICE